MWPVRVENNCPKIAVSIESTCFWKLFCENYNASFPTVLFVSVTQDFRSVHVFTSSSVYTLWLKEILRVFPNLTLQTDEPSQVFIEKYKKFNLRDDAIYGRMTRKELYLVTCEFRTFACCRNSKQFHIVILTSVLRAAVEIIPNCIFSTVNRGSNNFTL